jgi:hypothetical protein
VAACPYREGPWSFLAGSDRKQAREAACGADGAGVAALLLIAGLAHPCRNAHPGPRRLAMDVNDTI